MNYRNQAKVAVPALAFGLGIAGIAGEVFEFHETTSETSSYRSCSQQESGSGGPSCLSEGAHWYSYSTSSSWSPSGETEPAQGNEWCPGLGRRGSPPPGLCGDQPVYTVTSTSVSGECVLVYRDDCYGSVPTCPTGECGSGGGNGSGGGGIPNVTPESSGLYGTGGTGDPFGEDQCEINASNCSVRLAFSLGRSARGRKIGHLLVSQPEPGPALSSPACLELVGQDLEGTAVLRNPDYSIRQILTHDQLIDVAVVGEGSWRVAFHPRPAELLRDADGWILPGGEPRRTATVSRAGEGDVAFVDRTGSRERHYRFLWKGGETGWALSVEGTGSYVLSRRTESPDGQTHERVKEHYSLDDRLLKRERWVYRQFPFGDLPVRYEVGDGTALRWHEIEYYEDPTDRASYGHAKASTESDGTWKRFVYSADGLSSTSIGPWKDSAPTFRPEEGRAVEVSYRFLRPGEEFYYPGAMVEQRTESILGVPVGRSFALRGHLPTGERLEVIERSASPGGRFGDPANLRDEYRYHPRREADPGSDQLAAIVRADGTATRYLYESGHYDGEGGVPGEFEPAAGGPFLRVTETTVPAALPGGIAGRTLSTRAVYTADQRQVLSETSVLAAAGETPRWERLSWTTTLYDGRNRVASRRDATGILSEYRYNDCCGKLEWERDADGSVVSHVHDALNRRTATVREQPGRPAVETHYRFDDLGRSVGETVVAGDLERTTSRTLDVFGRVVESVSADGLVTRHAYDDTARTHTTTLPGGATRIETRHLDGQTRSVTGTAQVAQHYDYGVDPETGDLWTQAFVAKAEGPRWSRSVSDALGRGVLSERPGHGEGTVLASHTAYDGKGRVVATQGEIRNPKLETRRALGPATLIAYHPETGETLFSGEDLDGNGRLEPGKDRLSRETVRCEEIDGSWWEVTRSFSFPLALEGRPRLLGESRQRLTGLGKPHEDPALGVLVAESVRLLPAENSKLNTDKLVTRSVTYRNRDTGLITAITTDPNGVVTVQRTEGGLLASVENFAANGQEAKSQTAKQLTAFAYDALNRRVSVTDPRTGKSTTTYDPKTGRVVAEADPEGRITRYAYYPADHPSAGRLATVGDAAGKEQHVAYTLRGEQRAVWGDSVQPILHDYNDYGEKVAIRTFQTLPDGDPSHHEEQGARTAWHYDEATGALLRKEYADGQGPEYVYTEAGQIESRTWARKATNPTDGAAAPVGTAGPAIRPETRLTTAYEYSEKTLQLAKSTATDGLEVVQEYDAENRPSKVTDATGTREFAYDVRGQIVKETITLLTGADTPPIRYELRRTYTPLGQPASVQLVSAEGETISLDHKVDYAWNTHGQLVSVTSPAGEFVYEYAPTNPALLAKMTGPVHIAETTYEPHRNLITGVVNRGRGARSQNSGAREDTLPSAAAGNAILDSSATKFSTTSPISSYAYTNDILGRRETISQGGEAFAMLKLGENKVDVAYNDRSEVVGAIYKGQNGVPPLEFAYAYDGIGNRREAAKSWVTGQGTREEERTVYTANALNQYTEIQSDSAPSVNSVGKPVHDPDGNLIDDTKNRYEWDSENRLVRVEAKNGKSRVEYVHDFQGRRTVRRAYSRAGEAENWQLKTENFYLYDGWNVLAEYSRGIGGWIDEASASPEGSESQAGDEDQTSNLKLNTWGRDLSGDLQGAGGVGGLLAVTEVRKEDENPSSLIWDSRFFLFDANGNVSQLVDESGGVTAAYTYDPFGNVTEMAGPEAEANPWRFSTKPEDGVTGWLYYGYRWLDPVTGRWPNRDPIGERGGINLHAFIGNDPVGNFDIFGMLAGPPQSSPTYHPLGQAAIAAANAANATRLPWVLIGATSPTLAQLSVTISQNMTAKKIYAAATQEDPGADCPCSTEVFYGPTDSQGRPQWVLASYAKSQPRTTPRRPMGKGPPGFDAASRYYDSGMIEKGHLWANRFGGEDNASNLITQFAYDNDPRYKAIEENVAKLADGHQSVCVFIRPIYREYIDENGRRVTAFAPKYISWNVATSNDGNRQEFYNPQFTQNDMMGRRESFFKPFPEDFPVN